MSKCFETLVQSLEISIYAKRWHKPRLISQIGIIQQTPISARAGKPPKIWLSVITLSINDSSGLGHVVVTPLHNMTKSGKFYKILTTSQLHQVMSSHVVSSPDAKYMQDTVIW